MLIDVPVLIAFDVNGNTSFDFRRLDRAVARLTLTLRIDTDDSNKPLQYVNHFPPRDDAQWSTDTDGIFAGLMPYGSEKKLVERARKSPTDYCADPKEAEILEEEIEQQRAANGHNGVGA